MWWPRLWLTLGVFRLIRYARRVSGYECRSLESCSLQTARGSIAVARPSSWGRWRRFNKLATGEIVAPFDSHPSEYAATPDSMVVQRLEALRPDRRFGAAWIRRRIHSPLGKGQPLEGDYAHSFRKLDPALATCDVVLSMGGDNYTLDYGRPEVFFALNRHVVTASYRWSSGEHLWARLGRIRIRTALCHPARRGRPNTGKGRPDRGVPRVNWRARQCETRLDPAFLMPAVHPSGMSVPDWISSSA